MRPSWTRTLPLVVLAGLGVWAWSVLGGTPEPGPGSTEQEGAAVAGPEPAAEVGAQASADNRQEVTDAEPGDGPFRIRGRVLDDRGIVRPGVEVLLFDASVPSSTPSLRTSTDPTGGYEFAIDHAGPDGFWVKARVPPSDPETGPGLDASTGGFKVRRGWNTAPELVIPRPAELELVLQSAAGQRVTDAAVRLLDEERELRTRVDTNGVAHLELAPSRSVRLRVEAAAPFASPTDHELGGLAPGPQRRLLVVPEGHDVELRFRLADGH
ncbi:MAG: hypothetical protein R3F30_08645 [Planctomycetota bacterium]